MKTLTLRVDDDVYATIKHAAEGARRNISNFIEYATLQYLTSSQYIDQNEMDEILDDAELMKSLQKGIAEAKSGDYTLVP
jgi:predicted transcriptional regulator